MKQRSILAAGLMLLLLTTGYAQKENQKEKQFYAGITGGLVIPGNLQEHWINSRMSQTADLTHLMNTGFLVGVKAGYTPNALRKILAVELEYNYQKTMVGRITSPGFVAGVDTLPAFSSEAENSWAEMHSIWMNLLVRYPKGHVHPFIGFSPGLTIATIAFHEENIVGKFGFEETGTDTDFAWQVQFGCDFDLNSLISVGGGYKYMAVTPKMPWANGTYSDYEYHSSTLFANITFHF